MQLNIREQFQKMFRLHLPESPGKIKAGLYHFRREDAANVTRFHLRVEDDGSGMLLANSSVAARLSAAGVTMAKALLEGVNESEITQQIRRNFRGAREEQVRDDLKRLNEFIRTLSNPEDNYPIFNLDDPAVMTPHHLFAPFHAQMSVAPAESVNPLLARLWENGVLHVTFAATEASSANDALRNIERAEDIGMISGLRGPASWLQTPGLLEQSAQAGVDYVTVPALAPQLDEHDAILGQGDFQKAMDCFGDCRKWEVCPVAEIPLFKLNIHQLPALLEMLQARGVRNVLYYAVAAQHQERGLSSTEIIQAAVDVEDLAHRSQVRYVWLAPVSMSGTLAKLIQEGPRTAGDVSIRVEPDGSVIPARGPRMVAGNLLRQDWKDIWNHAVFRRYRERIESPTRCAICPGLAICAADCPGVSEG
jgi:radical SAM protein with 4Fe4S-binding SPASM domain